MKKILLSLFLMLSTSLTAMAQLTDYSIFKKHFNIFIANDLGRNGYYDQKPIAELMGQMAEAGANPEFVVATGDVHHFDGVASVNDPLWLTNYELIYSHPELMIAWHPLLGNHEYRGNTQAVMDYSHVSRRWQMPARYYTQRYEHKGMTMRILWIDTTPLISKYRDDREQYPDAALQDDEAQLAWIDSVLTAATEQWVIVCGHHPMRRHPRRRRNAPTCSVASTPSCASIMWTSTSAATSTISSTCASKGATSTMWSTRPVRSAARWSPSRAPVSAAPSQASPSSRPTRSSSSCAWWTRGATSSTN